MSGHGDKDKELMELKHDALPGFRPVFYVVFALGIIYLAAVFYFD